MDFPSQNPPSAESSAHAADGFSIRLCLLHHVTLELSLLETEEALYRRAIELGRERLGFDRLGIWLLDAEGENFSGTFGIDETGGLRDERHRRVPIREGYNVEPVLTNRQPRIRRTGLPLRGGGGVVGHGDMALAPLWDGGTALGYISTDNLLTQRPITEQDSEILHLFATSIGHLISRLRAAAVSHALEERWRALAAGLHGILVAADELMGCRDLTTLYRRAVELGREQLGLERCSLFLTNSEWAFGAFGTDLQGRTVDERAWRARKTEEWELPPHRTHNEDPRWLRLEKELVEWREGQFHGVGHGWVVLTAIDPLSGRIGFFCNDSAISHAPFDETRQELVALYVSLLGTIIERKRSELRDGAFKRLGQQLNAAAAPEDAARTVLQVADELLGWDSCWLELCNPAEGDLHTIILMDLVNGVRTDVPPSQPGISGWTQDVIRDGPLLILRQAVPERPPSGFGDLERASASIMVVPIRSGTAIIGAVSIQSYSANVYNEDDLDTLQALADYCGGALERTRAEAERRRLEAQLIQAQRLEAIGRLAGGLAHDFNNMLAVINGYSELLLSDMTLPERVRRSAQEIRAAGERSTTLTRQLLAFSRRQLVTPRALDLEAVLRAAESSIRGVLGEKICLLTRVETNLGKVRFDLGQLEQVLLALAAHAAASIPQAYKLTYEARNESISAPRNGVPDRVPSGGYVVLEARISGSEIPAEALPHLFEPFFSLPGVRDGTGFGLAAVYGSVHQNDGFVEVESKPGRGTCFRLFLPQVAERGERPVPSRGPEVPAPPQKTVLVVEEEEMLRGLINRVLQSGGFKVLTAGSGEAAVRLCRSHPGRIDLLLADLLLPPAGSLALSQEWETRFAGVPVILLSGFSDTVQLQGNPFHTRTFLSKPFSPNALLDLVREVLDGVPSEAKPRG